MDDMEVESSKSLELCQEESIPLLFGYVTSRRSRRAYCSNSKKHFNFAVFCWYPQVGDTFLDTYPTRTSGVRLLKNYGRKIDIGMGLCVMSIVCAMSSSEEDEQLELEYLDGRVVLPLDYESSKRYDEYLSEVPEFEDVEARKRAEEGELVLTEIPIWRRTHPPHEPLTETEVFWFDNDTDEVWKQETFEKMGKIARGSRWGDCLIVREPEKFAAYDAAVKALRDAVERALWEQQKSMSEHVQDRMSKLGAARSSALRSFRDEWLYPGLKTICSAVDSSSDRVTALEKENAALRCAVEQLQQQFNTLSLALEPTSNPSIS